MEKTQIAEVREAENLNLNWVDIVEIDVRKQ